MIQETISLLKKIEAEHMAPVAFACSFGLEDMVLLDMISKHARRIEVFTLDTVGFPNETYDLLDQVRDTYSVPIRIYFPDAKEVEEWVRAERSERFLSQRVPAQTVLPQFAKSSR
jgi:phosphoadenosine phosphosulfate reductase